MPSSTAEIIALTVAPDRAELLRLDDEGGAAVLAAFPLADRPGDVRVFGGDRVVVTLPSADRRLFAGPDDTRVAAVPGTGSLALSRCRAHPDGSLTAIEGDPGGGPQTVWIHDGAEWSPLAPPPGFAVWDAVRYDGTTALAGSAVAVSAGGSAWEVTEPARGRSEAYPAIDFAGALLVRGTRFSFDTRHELLLARDTDGAWTSTSLDEDGLAGVALGLAVTSRGRCLSVPRLRPAGPDLSPALRGVGGSTVLIGRAAVLGDRWALLAVAFDEDTRPIGSAVLVSDDGGRVFHVHTRWESADTRLADVALVTSLAARATQ